MFTIRIHRGRPVAKSSATLLLPNEHLNTLSSSSLAMSPPTEQNYTGSWIPRIQATPRSYSFLRTTAFTTFLVGE